MRDDRARGRMGKGGGAGVSAGLERKIWLRKWEIDLLDLDKWLIEIVSFFFSFSILRIWEHSISSLLIYQFSHLPNVYFFLLTSSFFKS